MSRDEAADALELMLNGRQALPRSALSIAHRIRRPEPQELTGCSTPTEPWAGDHQSGADHSALFRDALRRAPEQPRGYPLTTLVLLACGSRGAADGDHAHQVRRHRHRSVRNLDLDLGGLPLETVQDGFHQHGFALTINRTTFQSPTP